MGYQIGLYVLGVVFPKGCIPVYLSKRLPNVPISRFNFFKITVWQNFVDFWAVEDGLKFELFSFFWSFGKLNENWRLDTEEKTGVKNKCKN